MSFSSFIDTLTAQLTDAEKRWSVKLVRTVFQIAQKKGMDYAVGEVQKWAALAVKHKDDAPLLATYKQLRERSWAQLV